MNSLKNITMDTYKNIIKEMYAVYLTGLSLKQVASIYNIDAPKLCVLFKQYNLKTRTPYKKKYFVNDMFFSKIDNEFKAYIVGFIFADGHINTAKNVLTFKIKKTDIDVLEKINECFESSYKILTLKNEKYCTLSITSKQIVEDLKNLGLTNRKTWNMPKQIKVQDDLLCHFFRGLIDGDGSVCVYFNKKEKKNKLYIAITGGDYDFLDLCDSIISQIIKCNKHKIQKSKENYGNSYYIKWTDNQALRLNEFLYKNANIYMNRKYENAKKFLGRISNGIKEFS